MSFPQAKRKSVNGGFFIVFGGLVDIADHTDFHAVDIDDIIVFLRLFRLRSKVRELFLGQNIHGTQKAFISAVQEMVAGQVDHIDAAVCQGVSQCIGRAEHRISAVACLLASQRCLQRDG